MRGFVLGMVLALLCGLAFGDTITLKDGTVVEGRIIMQSEDAVLVKTTGGETQSIPKEKIAKIEKSGTAAAPTRKTYKCRQCYDTHRIKCPDCKGSGKPKGKSCPQCRGLGRVTCKECSGSGTAKCMKCRGMGKVMTSSQAADGRPLFGLVTCTECRGTGKVRCITCRGKGKTPCPGCNGVGWLRTSGRCVRCDGTGRITCPYCGEAGGVAGEPGKIASLVPTGPVMSKADKQKRIRAIEAEIERLQAELQKLKFKDPSTSALKAYMNMEPEDRAMVRAIRDRLRSPRGYQYYCRLGEAEEAMIGRSLLLREVLRELEFEKRRAREDLK